MSAPRHKWSKGLEQQCVNAGCPWRRRNRSDASGYATSTMEYKRDGFLVRWETETRVPPCEGRP